MQGAGGRREELGPCQGGLLASGTGERAARACCCSPRPPRFLLRAVLVLSPVAGLSHGHCLTEIAADLPRALSQAVPAGPGGWLVWFEAPFTPLLPWVLLWQEPRVLQLVSGFVTPAMYRRLLVVCWGLGGALILAASAAAAAVRGVPAPSGAFPAGHTRALVPRGPVPGQGAGS